MSKELEDGSREVLDQVAEMMNLIKTRPVS